MDYLHFLYGFGLTLLAIVSIALRRTKNARLPWTWLALFGIIHGLDEWVILLSIGVDAGPLFDAIRDFVTILSFACLAEFGLAGMTPRRTRRVGRLLLVCALAAAAVGSLTGQHVLTQAATCVLRLVGTLSAALALLLAARADSGSGRCSLTAAGAAMALYAGVTALSFAILPVELVSAVLIISASAALSCYCQCGSSAREDPAVIRARRRTAVWTTVTVAAVLALGFVLTNLISNQADKSFRSNLLSRTILAGSSINPRYVQALTGTAADAERPDFRLLRRRLQCIHVANDDYRYVCLMGQRRGKTIFLVDAEPERSSTYSPPGTVYKSASGDLIRSFSTPRPFVEGPRSDEYGSWVSGLAPILDPFTGRIIAVLGMDVPEEEWREAIGQHRLLCIAGVFLLCMLAITLFYSEHYKREAAARIAASELRYRSLVENTNDWVWDVDENGVLRYCSPRCRDLLGYEPEELIGRRFGELRISSESESGANNDILQLVFVEAHLPIVRVENMLLHRDGRRVPVETSGTPVFGSDGVFRGYLGTDRDVTEQKKAESELRMQTSAINAASDQIIIINAEGRVEFVNAAFERESGYTQEEIVGQTPAFLLSPEQDKESLGKIRQTMTDGTTWHGEMSFQRKDGSGITSDVTITPVKNASGTTEHFIGIGRDITQKKMYEEQLDHLAHHDPLTGLPNRLLFSDRLTQRLSQARRNSRPVAVMFLDLDRFKMINDTLGHNTGDLLLKTVAERLTESLREADTIARMGGDEFTIILSDIAGAQDAARVAKRVLESLSTPFVLDGHELFVTASIGISLYPSDGENVETLVRNADTAMYRAKELGRDNYHLYTEALNAAILERMTLENNLRKAVERDEFVLHYQPRVDMKTGKILGVEALVRWQHPDLGLIPPIQFIPLAEETGLIVPISEWVMRTACRQNRDWQDAGLGPMPVAVNISSRQFQQDDLVATVKRVLDETGLDPQYLDMELTESTLMRNPDVATVLLRVLKSMGVRISIDDFGTGYSSLSYLKGLPIDALKIDQSFVRDITTKPEDAAMAGGVVAMAHSLNLTVIAEGVETLEQLKILSAINCDEMQGYFIGKPMAADDLEQMLVEKDQGRRKLFAA